MIEMEQQLVHVGQAAGSSTARGCSSVSGAKRAYRMMHVFGHRSGGCTGHDRACLPSTAAEAAGCQSSKGAEQATPGRAALRWRAWQLPSGRLQGACARYSGAPRPPLECWASAACQTAIQRGLVARAKWAKGPSSKDAACCGIVHLRCPEWRQQGCVCMCSAEQLAALQTSWLNSQAVASATTARQA